MWIVQLNCTIYHHHHHHHHLGILVLYSWILFLIKTLALITRQTQHILQFGVVNTTMGFSTSLRPEAVMKLAVHGVDIVSRSVAHASSVILQLAITGGCICVTMAQPFWRFMRSRKEGPPTVNGVKMQNQMGLKSFTFVQYTLIRESAVTSFNHSSNNLDMPVDSNTIHNF
jgi:hypothetical protein